MNKLLKADLTVLIPGVCGHLMVVVLNLELTEML